MERRRAASVGSRRPIAPSGDSTCLERHRMLAPRGAGSGAPMAVGVPVGLELRKMITIAAVGEGLKRRGSRYSRVLKERDMNSRWKTLVAFSAALLLVGVVVAQDPAQRLREQPQQPARPGAAVQPGQPGAAGGGLLDSHLAQCLTMDNQNEIALAEVAKQRSQDNEVKQFADRLIQDHTQFLQQLARFAGNQPAMAGGQPGEGRPNERTGQPAAAGQPGAMAQAQGGQPNFLALKQQIGQKALE